MKTTFLPRLAGAGLLATVWLATSAYTAPTLGTFRPATTTGAANHCQSLKGLEIGQLRSSQYILDDPATMYNFQVATFASGQEPTLPGSLLETYTATDFTEFDQLPATR